MNPNRKETLNFIVVVCIALNTLAPRGLLSAKQCDLALDLIKNQSSLINTLLLSDIPLRIVNGLMSSRAAQPAPRSPESDSDNDENRSSEYFITSSKGNRELQPQSSGLTPFTLVHLTGAPPAWFHREAASRSNGGETVFTLLIALLFLVILARGAIDDAAVVMTIPAYSSPASIKAGFFFLRGNK